MNPNHMNGNRTKDLTVMLADGTRYSLSFPTLYAKVLKF